MYAPEKNYIYKYSPVEAFAIYTEFGKDIGSGSGFKLAHYYELGDIVVEALKEHPELLRKHAEILDDTYYRDESLHLLAFDIIYCADTYGYFKDLKCRAKKDAIKAYTAEQQRKAEAEERQAAIDAVEQQIMQLESQLDVYRSISLVGTQVQQLAVLFHIGFDGIVVAVDAVIQGMLGGHRIQDRIGNVGSIPSAIQSSHKTACR